MLRLAILATIGFTFMFSAVLHAEDIVEAHIKAVGGQDAISKIKTIHRTGSLSGTTSYGPLNGAVEEIFDLSKSRGYVSVEMTGYSRKVGWSGKSGWTSDTQAGVTDMPADEMEYAKSSGQPSPIAAIAASRGGALKEAGVKEWNGKECTIVTVEGAPMEFYVNQKTKLLEGILIPGAEVSMEDYKAIDGVLFANKRTIKIEAQNLTMVYEYSKTNVNGKIDEAKFKRPSGTDTKKGATPNSETYTGKQIIGYLDKNGDGKISKDEASEDLKLFFANFDTNEDGTIDVKEAQAMANHVNSEQPGYAKPTANRVTAKQLMSLMDKDGDEKISKEEATEEVRTNFQYIDTNGDGAIDLKEAKLMADYANEQMKSTDSAPASERYSAQQIVDSMDTNGDGKIGKDEASDELKPYFDQHDSNGNGAIDVKEAQVIANYLNKDAK